MNRFARFLVVPRTFRTIRFPLSGLDVHDPETYSFRRYLEAKRTIDDRAFDRRVLGKVKAEVANSAAPLRVLEVGAGIGTMIERVMMWESLPDRVEYTAVDIDRDIVAVARERLRRRTRRSTLAVPEAESTLRVEREGRHLAIDLIARDAFEFIEETDKVWDLVIGQAFMDTTAVLSALRTLFEAVSADGLVYFPITFDGGTIFEPTIDFEFDDRIERRYHRHEGALNEQDDIGDKYAGRHLLTAIPDLGGRVIAVGGSDWVVLPEEDGYPADEAYFLHHIVEVIHDTLSDDPTLDNVQFDNWIERRHQQIDEAQLVYIAHQLDVLGRGP